MRWIRASVAAGTVFFFMLSTGIGAFCQKSSYPFQDSRLTADQRIDNLLSLLTLQEKIDLLGKNLNIPRLGIHGSGHLDSIPGSSGQVEGLHGLAMSPGWAKKSPGGPGTRGGTSVIPTTQFPQAAGLGATWDPALIEKAASLEGDEARYIFERYDRGGLIVRAPNADLARDPRWGRAEESYGEDPFLDGTMATAFVHGLQGNDPQHWNTVSLVKHFLANSNEDNRVGSSSNFDSRLLHEYYAVPFRMAIEDGKADALMTAYNAVNGIPMAASPLLRDLAMQRWGFNGLIDTDRGALTFMVTKHHYYPDMAHAAAGAIHAGVNQFLNEYQQPVKDALQQKLITETDIDANLRGLLRVMLRLGLLDSATPNPPSAAQEPWDRPESRQLALQVTQESIVLLKNAQHLLPLNASAIHSIAVAGPLADEVDADGYGGTPPFRVTPLEGIRAVAGPRVEVRYGADLDSAVKLAKTSDVAVVVVGNRPICHSKATGPCRPSEGEEGVDRKQIDLGPEQQQLVRAVYAANPRTVLVVVSGFPYAIDWSAQHVPAILHMAHSSEVEGTALAQAIFGEINPSGHLVVTWPSSLQQLPPMMDYNLRDGRTYMYFRQKPLFPFGYGLSYTSFRYRNLRVQHAELGESQTADISVEVQNTGRLKGDDVVQLYVKHLNSRVERPLEELKGFARVSLAPGEQRTVHLSLPAKSLAYWDEGKKNWTIEHDKVKVMIGESSADVKLAKVIAVGK